MSTKLLHKTVKKIAPQDAQVRARARARLEQLTMPHWALGRLMDLAEDLAGMTGTIRPSVKNKAIVIMAADHGVTAEGVSKYPQEVTSQMVRNFIQGGAGINALAGVTGARILVADLGVAGQLDDLHQENKIISKRIGPGTRNMMRGPAMNREEAIRSIEAGIDIANDLGSTVDLFGTGDMGIGNTTPSTAIASIVTGHSVEEIAGHGTGIDEAQRKHKISVIEKCLRHHQPLGTDGLDIMVKVGGFEIGGIVGLILGAAAQRKPILIDGFISTAGALIAQLLAPDAMDYVIASHQSAEKGHRLMLKFLKKEPLLNLNLRLGEGTGAALAMNLVESSVRILTEVATFEEARVPTAVS